MIGTRQRPTDTRTLTTRVPLVLLAIVAAVLAAIGLVGGVVFIQWMLRSLATTTLPDVGIDLYVSPTTIVVAAVVGIAVVALAPVLLARRIATMDVPDALRIME